jgi:DNA polymerase III epsilon subunit-like protein
MKIVVLDTETTGLDLTMHEIIQIGFITIDADSNNSYRVLSQKEIKIRPEHLKNASVEALKINGFSVYEWRDSLPFQHYANHIKETIEYADLLLGQNLLFDLRFIKQAFSNLSLEAPKFPPYIDTKNMAEPLVKQKILESTSMDKMCKHYNISFTGRAHNALADCERTLKIWEKLLTYDEAPNIFTFENPYDPYANKTK